MTGRLRLTFALALLLALAAALSFTPAVSAQAIPAGKGPGSYISLGVAASAFDSPYGEQRLGGATLFLDANVYRRTGFEAEARTLRFHSPEGVRQTTYLIGPKVSTHGRSLRPYLKLLAGRGEMRFPFRYAYGSYFVAVPGAGLDLRIGRGAIVVRVLDLEYQLWPGFTFGAMHPYGLSTGVSFTLFAPRGRES